MRADDPPLGIPPYPCQMTSRLLRLVALSIGLTMTVGAVASAPATAATKKRPAKATAAKKTTTKKTAKKKPAAGVSLIGTAKTKAPRGLRAVPVPPPGPLVWEQCSKKFPEFECAVTEVPLDYTQPVSPLIEVSVTRRKANNQAARIGTLFVNPGGPGATADSLVAASARVYSAAILDRFDIIGVDPRGTDGAGTVLDCGSDGAEDLLPDPEDLDKLTGDQYAQILGKQCGVGAGQLLPFMSTENVARDFDRVRQSLGEEKITFVGFSYGTYLGAVYGTLFPTRLRGMILDGALDPTRFGSNILLDSFAGWEKTLDGFFAACTDGTLKPCVFGDGGDVVNRYNAILARLPENNDPSLTATDYRAEFEARVLDLLRDPVAGWAQLGYSLRKASTQTNPTDIVRSIPGDTGGGGGGSSIVQSYFSFVCRDGLDPATAEEYAAVRAGIPAATTRFTAFANRSVAVPVCQYWPARPAPRVPLVAPAGVPVLIIGSTFDTQTPFVWAQGLSAQLGAPLLTRNGGGHVGIARSNCIDDNAAKFLLDLALPAAGTACPAF
jgi:pimeloyl-ACP methyl ester carboxylesterase